MSFKRYLYLFFIAVFASCSQQEPDPAKSSQKNLISFSFNSLNPPINASIDSVQRLITATVPSGTDISKLVPTIVPSSKATLSPASGVAQDFTKPVTYTVTAEDGSRQTFTATVMLASAISDQIAQGKTSATQSFTLKTALYKKETLFGKEGYSFNLYNTSADCNSGLPPISFFVTKLDIGPAKGSGPYFFYSSGSSTSFLGCDVIITSVTATTVEGKVKGGSLSTSQYIEGKFTATLCK